MKIKAICSTLIICVSMFVSIVGCGKNDTKKVDYIKDGYIHIYSEKNGTYSDDVSQIKENVGQKSTFDKDVPDNIKQLFNNYLEEMHFVFDYYLNPSGDNLLENEKTYIKEYEISPDSSIKKVQKLDNNNDNTGMVYLDFCLPYAFMNMNLEPKKININGTTYYVYDDEFKETIYGMATFYNMIIKTYYTEE